MSTATRSSGAGPVCKAVQGSYVLDDFGVSQAWDALPQQVHRDDPTLFFRCSADFFAQVVDGRAYGHLPDAPAVVGLPSPVT
ncbi:MULTISPECIES: hypothetical protein [unclassified Streptomyces]|uniref:hypothetical protein n=1 Tax=unclassified Streptomyces TaxID=2593676 RepID=UPI0033FD5835